MMDKRDQDQQNELLKVDIDSIVEKGEKRNNYKRVMIILVVAILALGIALFLFMRGTPVEDIAFSENEVEVIAGKSLELNYTILPNNATSKGLVWESSDTEIAKVDDKGVITAERKGTVTITATAPNGKQDECLVTVKPTAFEFLKELSATKNGYTIGNSSAYEMDVSLGAYYQENEDSIYIMLATENFFSTGLASIAIPSSLSGEYKGYLEFNSRSAGTITTTYLVDAASFTSETSLKSFYSDSSPSSTSINDELYTSDLRNMLIEVYQEILEPNGYTYADLGFTSFS